MKVLLIEKRASRGYVDQRLEALEETVSQSLTRMEQVVVNCMLRRDEKWRRELSKLKVTSTPQTPRTVPRWSLDVSDIPRGSSSVSQSAYAKPPVRIMFPCFGENRDATEVFNFVEQCENFLSLRPLSNGELIASLDSRTHRPGSKLVDGRKG